MTFRKLAQIALVVSMGLLGVVLEAQTKTDPKANDPLVKFKKGLQSKCETDGIAAACFQYAQALEESDIPEERKRANFYARRACMMAYAPACGRESAANDAGKERAPGSAAKGCFTPEVFANLNLVPTSTKAGLPGQKLHDVEKLPMFAKSGVQTGDIILKVNGKNLEAPSQIADGLDSGRMDIEVERAGKTIPLSITCSP